MSNRARGRAGKQTTTPREAVGIVLIVVGVAVLVWTY
jgi:hypothetical protein